MCYPHMAARATAEGEDSTRACFPTAAAAVEVVWLVLALATALCGRRPLPAADPMTRCRPAEGRQPGGYRRVCL